MSLTTLAFLEHRLNRADQGWMKAMARKGYKDDPEEEGPFNATETRLWRWANCWRLMVHMVENELDQLPEARTYRAEHGPQIEPTQYMQEQTPSRMVRDFGPGEQKCKK